MTTPDRPECGQLEAVLLLSGVLLVIGGIAFAVWSVTR